MLAYAAQALWIFLSEESGTTGYGTFIWRKGWGERGCGGGGGECESDPISTPVEMCSLSPLAGLRLKA
jgi:hypothetical protein